MARKTCEMRVCPSSLAVDGKALLRSSKSREFTFSSTSTFYRISKYNAHDKRSLQRRRRPCQPWWRRASVSAWAQETPQGVSRVLRRVTSTHVHKDAEVLDVLNLRLVDLAQHLRTSCKERHAFGCLFSGHGVDVRVCALAREIGHALPCWHDCHGATALRAQEARARRRHKRVP